MRLLSPKSILRTAVHSFAVACALAAQPVVSPAVADVPAGTPVFSNPLDITNEFQPIVPGTLKVYAGTSEGQPAMVVETHTFETRAFEWNGTTLQCRVVTEIEFRRGLPDGRERLYLAQADDGSVWAFGEQEDSDPNDDGGNDAQGAGGWIVGQRAPSDPATMTEVAGPALRMPGVPAVPDSWTMNAGLVYEESHRVLRTDETLRAPGRRFAGVVRIRETDVPDGESQLTWHAPGAGLVRVRGDGESLTLRASTLRAGR